MKRHVRPGLTLRKIGAAEDGALRALFYETVHIVCAADYSAEELDAWAPRDYDRTAWGRTLRARCTLAAETEGVLAGFGNIGPDGYLDLLYVGWAFQGRGVGTALCDALEGLYDVPRVTVCASRTARPFFAWRGYCLVRAQQVERRGVTLENFLMEKEL